MQLRTLTCEKYLNKSFENQEGKKRTTMPWNLFVASGCIPN